MYRIAYHSETDGWIELSGWEESSEISSGKWNQLSVRADDKYAKFYINNHLVYENNLDELKHGYCGVAFSKYDTKSATFQFDNFILRTPQ